MLQCVDVIHVAGLVLTDALLTTILDRCLGEDLHSLLPLDKLYIPCERGESWYCGVHEVAQS